MNLKYILEAPPNIMAKLTNADLRSIIANHFAEQGKRITNLSKTPKAKLLELIKTHNIIYDEEATTAKSSSLKQQKKDAERKYEDDREMWKRTRPIIDAFKDYYFTKRIKCFRSRC